jgi:hypothetical protein
MSGCDSDLGLSLVVSVKAIESRVGEGMVYGLRFQFDFGE